MERPGAMKEDHYFIGEWEHYVGPGVRHALCNDGLLGGEGSLDLNWCCRTCGSRIPLTTAKTFRLLYPTYHWVSFDGHY